MSDKVNKSNFESKLLVSAKQAVEMTRDSDGYSFGQRLRHLRLYSDLSIEQFSSMTSLSTDKLEDIEKMKCLIEYKHIQLYVLYTEVELEVILRDYFNYTLKLAGIEDKTAHFLTDDLVKKLKDD